MAYKDSSFIHELHDTVKAPKLRAHGLKIFEWMKKQGKLRLVGKDKSKGIVSASLQMYWFDIRTKGAWVRRLKDGTEMPSIKRPLLSVTITYYNYYNTNASTLLQRALYILLHTLCIVLTTQPILISGGMGGLPPIYLKSTRSLLVVNEDVCRSAALPLQVACYGHGRLAISRSRERGSREGLRMCCSKGHNLPFTPSWLRVHCRDI